MPFTQYAIHISRSNVVIQRAEIDQEFFVFSFIAVIAASGRVTGRQRIKCGAIQWQQPQSPKHFIATKSKYFSEPKTLLKF